ncbi:hypothetical protein IT417_03340 [bacterium]|nr:hypothetical protein [bacterium]
MVCTDESILKGFVFVDLDRNGVREGRERGLKNVEISLLDDEGKVLTVVKSEDTGEYKFSTCVGNYTLKATYNLGKNSFLNQDTLSVTTESFSQNQNFPIYQNKSTDPSLFLWMGVTLLGFGILFFAKSKIL